MSMDIKDRLKLIMDDKGLNNGEFAKEIGVVQSTISNIFGSRGTNPSMDVILRFHKRYPTVNLEWLLAGEGDMYNDGSPDAPQSGQPEDSGYPHVAADYKRSTSTGAVADVPVNEKTVHAALEPVLSLSGEKLEQIVDKVVQALLGIGFEACSPRLMVELARHYRDSDSESTPVLSLCPHPLKPGDDVMLLRPSDFHTLASVNLKDLLTGESLRVHGVSRLFAALKVDISLTRFADAMELSKPVSELALQSTWGRLVQGVDEICEKAERFCRQESDPPALPLPLCLSFRDAETFAVSYMDCPNAVTEGCIHGFVTDFTACLKQKPFKINID